jgi:hypothetical protein
VALGYCMVEDCQKLVSIKPGPQKWGSRECAWFPIRHDKPSGAPCDGHKKEIK